MRATILLFFALVLACESKNPSVTPSRPTQGPGERSMVQPSPPVPAVQPPATPPPSSLKLSEAKPLTVAEIRARSKECNAWIRRRNAEDAAKKYAGCAADAYQVIRKMVACKMDVDGVTVQWMCQKLNPANIAVLAGTEGCEKLHAWRSK